MIVGRHEEKWSVFCAGLTQLIVMHKSFGKNFKRYLHWVKLDSYSSLGQ